MKKTTLTKALFVAGAVALAGAAQADAIFYPDGTVVELGDTDLTVMQSGAVVASPSSSDSLDVMASSDLDTSVLGAGPARLSSSTTTTTTVAAPRMVYVQPSIDWDRSTALTQMRTNQHLVRGAALDEATRKQAAATFDVPARAGEASTMTGGAPNALTSNDHVVVGSYTIPHAVVSSDPYYVFSW